MKYEKQIKTGLYISLPFISPGIFLAFYYILQIIMFIAYLPFAQENGSSSNFWKELSDLFINGFLPTLFVYFISAFYLSVLFILATKRNIIAKFLKYISVTPLVVILYYFVTEMLFPIVFNSALNDPGSLIFFIFGPLFVIGIVLAIIYSYFVFTKFKAYWQEGTEDKVV